jgi:ketosteroid isomerase-like protein
VSEENVNTVRRATEAFLQHDNEAALGLYHPEVEIHSGRLSGSRVYRGLDGVREYFGDYLADMHLLGLEVDEWIDAGDEVVAVFRLWGQGRKSGVPVEEHGADVWTLRDGKLWRLRVFGTKEEALKAAGLDD